jgi:hypothetical protein
VVELKQVKLTLPGMHHDCVDASFTQPAEPAVPLHFFW